MQHNERTHWIRVLGLVSAGEGVLLSAGLEACFGTGRYQLIMVLGALGGIGSGLLMWLVRTAWQRCETTHTFRPFILAATVPAVAIGALMFIWRIIPLIREELKYTL